ncbi:MAG: hypothetical protein KC493_07710 [Bacteriovoracaceae bacterium]|nr:hypothetical protein [Bacteriovoracaceae bacterium]
MSRRIKVIEKQGLEVLFECDIQEEEKAYTFAKEMEELGIDIEVQIPSVTETLISTLGANEEDVSTLKKMMDEEIESHNDANCDDCIPEPINKEIH